MESMEGWDLILLVVVGYLAVNLLIRMMLAHRNRAARQLSDQLESAQRQNRPTVQKKVAS
jgi:hypothetical protein